MCIWTSFPVGFGDQENPPSFDEFNGLAEAIVKEGVAPRIISESDGTQSDDALAMKAMWLAAGGKE